MEYSFFNNLFCKKSSQFKNLVYETMNRSIWLFVIKYLTFLFILFYWVVLSSFLIPPCPPLWVHPQILSGILAWRALGRCYIHKYGCRKNRGTQGWFYAHCLCHGTVWSMNSNCGWGDASQDQPGVSSEKRLKMNIDTFIIGKCCVTLNMF